MARSLFHTYSDSKHFEDRRGKGYAHPITERINVCRVLSTKLHILTCKFSLIHAQLYLTIFQKALVNITME